MFYATKSWNDSQLPDLKPCPFCGAKAGMLHIGNSRTASRKVTIRCRVSGCCSGITVGAKMHDMEWCEVAAIKAWNKRV